MPPSTATATKTKRSPTPTTQTAISLTKRSKLIISGREVKGAKEVIEEDLEELGAEVQIFTLTARTRSATKRLSDRFQRISNSTPRSRLREAEEVESLDSSKIPSSRQMIHSTSQSAPGKNQRRQIRTGSQLSSTAMTDEQRPLTQSNERLVPTT